MKEAVCFFLLNLLAWHWFTKPYRFPVYNSRKHHLHTALCTHLPKQSFSAPVPHLHLCPPPPPQPPFPLGTTPLLSVSVVCMYVWFFLFLLNPFTFFHPVPAPLSPLTAVSLFSGSMSLFLFCLLVYFVN